MIPNYVNVLQYAFLKDSRPYVHVTKSTYLLHQDDTDFSRNPTVNPPLASQVLSLCVLATVTLKAAVLMHALRCPISMGEGEKAHTNTTALPPGIMALTGEGRGKSEGRGKGECGGGGEGRSKDVDRGDSRGKGKGWGGGKSRFVCMAMPTDEGLQSA